MSVISLENIPNSTVSEDTHHMRYVLRNGERVLQQMWEVKTFDSRTLKCIGLHGEWRDVPTEADE